jgi:hypothetical protein
LRQAGQPIVIPGLWALAFGNGNAAGPKTQLFFTAGIDDEKHGLFGYVKAVGEDQSAHAGADSWLRRRSGLVIFL